jgi:hypothetical protein
LREKCNRYTKILHIFVRSHFLYDLPVQEQDAQQVGNAHQRIAEIREQIHGIYLLACTPEKSQDIHGAVEEFASPV